MAGRFISKAGDRCSPFFRCLRNSKKRLWDSGCEAAFTKLKKYLTSAPILVALKEGMVLSLYLGVSDTAVSVVLLDSVKGVQHPIFYTIHILLDTESRYPTLGSGPSNDSQEATTLLSIPYYSGRHGSTAPKDIAHSRGFKKITQVVYRVGRV
ncbi:hypothetical protein AXF42_Ash016213 [Apostasia shenzhenica]|uniref:Reverse transcriptase/retrotransposon-derived protein RNase H-like domain-containing protein n=1 Tax=Apostasia shenzhenica TaxID=1088818 RepID=A0A2I0AET0_9ASPA|nr:hypothetical protein AXF42_Ash016213 [Apostasia shenzhenica]